MYPPYFTGVHTPTAPTLIPAVHLQEVRQKMGCVRRNHSATLRPSIMSRSRWLQNRILVLSMKWVSWLDFSHFSPVFTLHPSRWEMCAAVFECVCVCVCVCVCAESGLESYGGWVTERMTLAWWSLWTSLSHWILTFSPWFICISLKAHTRGCSISRADAQGGEGSRISHSQQMKRL